MGFVEAVRSVFRQYAVFGGRARRSEYWWFTLFNTICSVLASVLDIALFGTAVDSTGPLSVVLLVAVLVPGLAVSWRRLHDTGRSGWWTLVGFVPIVGWIIIVVFTVQDSHPGANRFGPSPKGAGAWAPDHGPRYGQP